MKKQSIKSISQSVSSGITPSRSNPDYWKGGTIPWLKTEQLGERYIFETNEKITEAALDQTSIKIHPVNTLSIAMYGEGKTRGKVSLLKREMATNQACCNVVLDESKVCPDFVYYSLKNQYINLRKLSSGVRKNLNSADIKGFQISLPESPNDQQKIAKVLSTLDAKIELNNQINAELEGMAKLLYDYWFVQFDFPMTQAQAAAMGQPELEGKPYKSSGGKMVYNKTLKRKIPEGWEDKELLDIANITMGQSPPGKSYNSEKKGELFFQGSTDFGWRYPSPRQYTTAPTRIAKAGDILLSVRAPVGTLNIAPAKCAIGRGLAAINSKNGCDSFLFLVMQYFKQIFDRRNGDGTTFGSINRDDLRSLKLALAPEPLVKKFENIVSKNNAMIFNNHLQNQELTELRDWLLPMLMNGQVTVSGS